MNSIERLEEVVHDIEKKPYGWRFPVGTIETHLETIGECLPALIAVAKAAQAAFKHNDIEDFGDNERLVALEDALATLKETGNG